MILGHQDSIAAFAGGQHLYFWIGQPLLFSRISGPTIALPPVNFAAFFDEAVSSITFDDEAIPSVTFDDERVF